MPPVDVSPAIAPEIAGSGPVCRDAARRADILAHPLLNGIDWIAYEYRQGDHPPHVLAVHMLKPLPEDAYGLAASPGLVKIHGGARIVHIQVQGVRKVPGNGFLLEIDLDAGGDFSTYWLSLGWRQMADGHWEKVVAALDHQFSRAPFSFKAGCPVDFDCLGSRVCQPSPAPELRIDYTAKDYASFRQLLVDLIPRLNPDWLERNPADLGITLVELLAYAGDHLSYYQDAVANEAFLDTCRQRVSAKRHARLIDYRMHDGRNAWTFVHLAAAQPGTVGQHTMLLTRIAAPLRGRDTPPPVTIAAGDAASSAFESDPALKRTVVFETAFPLGVYPENNEIYLHTWGDKDCCLPRGSTSAFVYSMADGLARRPRLNPGDYLLIEEVMGPQTGLAADADPLHRQVVRIVKTLKAEDGVYGNRLDGDRLRLWKQGDSALPLVQVFWSREDALGFAACLSASPAGKAPLSNVSVARGNIVLADHGLTGSEKLSADQVDTRRTAPRLPLARGPLTLQCQPAAVAYAQDPFSQVDRLDTPRYDLGGDSRQAVPAVVVRVASPEGTHLWTPVPDLLDSGPFDRHFVADLDHQGMAVLRFGDGEYGRRLDGFDALRVSYRVGNGRRGNIGAESLAHIVKPEPASGWPTVTGVRNPLAAADGTDPETIQAVRQYAPAAFHAEQFRAVTAGDYAAAARKMPGVAGAAAMFRWTGSWYTVFLGIDPLDPQDLITDPGGRTRLDPLFARQVQDFVTCYTLAGYDLEIRAGRYVPLALDLKICVKPDHFRGDVAEAVRRRLSNQVNPDGGRGFFHPDYFTFGDPVYLSRIYAVVEAVDGVESVVATRFQRYGEIDNGELQTGVLPMGTWEIARLDNDPNFMENGVLEITAGGGK